jgi:cytochrome b
MTKHSPKKSSKKIIVYDIPTRIFHWFLALGFTVTYFIASQLDSESALFFYHMLIGICLGLAVILRIIWGFIGTRYARFDSLQLHPRLGIAYFKKLFSRSADFDVGHNPASSWALIGFLILPLLQLVTGIMMALGYKEELEDIHSIFADSFFILAILHILGVIAHSLKYRTMLPSSMIFGLKEIEGHAVSAQNSDLRVSQGLIENGQDISQNLEGAGISKLYPKVGILFLISMFFCLGFLYRNFDSNRKVLTLFGVELILGKAEE